MGIIIADLEGIVQDYTLLNAADFSYSDILQISPSGQKRFVGTNPSSLSGDPRDGNSHYFYGSFIMTQTGTGKIIITSPDQYPVPQQNWSDTYSLSGSSRVGPGNYLIQFTYNSTKQFIDAIANDSRQAYLLLKETFEVYDYSSPTDAPTLLGKCHFGVNQFADFNFDEGRIRVMTTDTSDNLADDILAYGVLYEGKIFQRSASAYNK